MGIAVLGPLEVDEGRVRLGSRDRVVLAALAARPGEVRAAEELADAVWGERLPASWSKNLQGCVSRLRKVLGAGAIETTPAGYRLAVLDGLDVVEFERLVGRARELLALGEPERARYAAGQALQLWRGRPLPELEEWEPASAEATRLDEVRLEVEELQLEASLQAGHHPEVLSTARSMVERAPLREVRWIQLALAQYRAGQQAEALRTLHRLKVVMSRELGLDPGPEVAALEQAILRQEPGLLVPAASAESSSCPYPGLRPYDEGDVELFFGRDRVVEESLDRLAGTGLLVLVGPSGSGKSSLLRAGVIPALRARSHQVRLITPGRHPVEALMSATSGGAESAVVVIDQAEELFSLCDDLEERAAFLHLVLAQAERAPVALGLRADRTGELAAYPDLARRIEPGLYLLGAMSSAELRTAVEGPARQAGLVVEPGLVDLLIREVESEPGALPLLSHALRQTWLRREGRTLTVEGYRATGGIRGAVAQSAEALYLGIDDDERPLLRELLLRMVVPGHDGAPVRQRLPLHQLLVDPRQERLVDLLVAARLVTSDDGVVELAHEAVARAWPRLRSWLEEDAERQRLLHHLTLAAADWEHLDRPDDELYRGARLTAVEAWRHQADLTDLEQEFLDASLARRGAEQHVAAERARAQAVLIRRLRASVFGAVVLLTLAIGAGFVAVGQAGQARDQADAARARQLSAQALGDADTPLSALLAVAAVRMDDTPETRASLATVLARHPSLIATSAPVGDGVDRLVRSPDGTRLATYDEHNVVSLVDVATGRVMARYDTDGPGVGERQFLQTSPLAWSPDGKTLAVGGQTWTPASLVLLDGFTLTPVPTQPRFLPTWRAKSPDVAFSADGRYVAASFMLMSPRNSSIDDATDRTRTMVWEVAHLGRHPSVIRMPSTGHAERMALSAHGRRVFVSSPVSAYSVQTGKRLWRLPGHGTEQPMDLSDDGRRLAVISGGRSNQISLVDPERGRVVRTLAGSQTLYDVDFSDDGGVVSAVGSAQLYTWKVTSSQPTQAMSIDDAWGVQLDPTSSRAYVTDPGEGTLVTWDLAGLSSYLRLASPHHSRLSGLQVGFLRPAGDGVHVANYTDDLELVNERTGRVAAARGARTWNIFTPGAWRPDGQRFALGAADGHLQVFDNRGRLHSDVRVADKAISDIDYAADGQEIAVGSLSGRVELLDASTWSSVGRPVQLDGPVAGVSLAPDGRTAFVVTRERPVSPGTFVAFQGWALLDLRTGSVIRDGKLPEGIYLFDDFSPDGVHVVLGFFSGRVWILDTRTGQAVDAPAPTHHSPIMWVGWSRNGRQILSADNNGTLALWDPSTGTVKDTVTVPGETFALGEFRAGTSDVTVLDGSGRILTWDTRPAQAVEFACRMAGRDLTDQEWRTYLGEGPQEAVCPSR